MKVAKMKVIDLVPHPKNEEIYGYDEDVSDLIERIKKSGKVHTLTVTSKGVILAGHRRRKACMELGWKEVNVEIRDFDTPEEEIEFIIDDNSTREKTKEQKSREAKELKKAETVLAEKRKIVTQNNNAARKLAEVADSPRQDEQGKASVASKLKFTSGREVDRAIATIDIIDNLKENGRNEDADLIRGVLNNRSVSVAEELARIIDIVEIPEEDKPFIKSGKKSSYSYVEQAKQKQNSTIETKICKTCGKVISDNTAGHLIDLGFKYDNDEDEYIYKFTILRYDKMTVLRGRIKAYTDTNEVRIDVMDNNFTPYAPFYNIECGNYDVVLNRINKAILNEFSKLKITKKNEKKDMKNEN